MEPEGLAVREKTPNLNKEAGIQVDIDEIKWFHSVELRPGVVTPGMASLLDLNTYADLVFGSLDIRGQKVLDVGTWDGFYSVEAFRRGAGAVTATDKPVWTLPGYSKAGFDLVKRETGFPIEDRLLDMSETTVENLGQTFDVVLFLGIIYHLPDPLSALHQMAKLTERCLVIETFMDLQESKRPMMVYYPGERHLHPPNHPQNGWGCNSALLQSLLKELGFETIIENSVPGHGASRSVFHAFKPGHGYKTLPSSKISRILNPIQYRFRRNPLTGKLWPYSPTITRLWHLFFGTHRWKRFKAYLARKRGKPDRS